MADERQPDDSAANGPADADEATEIETFIDPAPASWADRTSSLFSQAETPDEPADEPPLPLRWVELIGALCLVVLCDVTIYRGGGFAGYALLFSVGPMLLWLSSHRRYGGPAVWIVAAMFAALAGKLAWCGSGPLVAIGFALIVAFSMAIAGYCPYVLEAFFFASRTLYSGYMAIVDYGRRVNSLGPVVPKSSWISVALPALAFLAFGWIFILANPDLSNWFGEEFERVFKALQTWVVELSPDPLEIGFWLVVLWIVGGLVRPTIDRAFAASSSNGSQQKVNAPPTDAFLYAAFRNTLITVIVLFALYLVFEFQTLWFREFKPGFYFSGYAHEGAAWLTAALALATVLLSLVFRGSILRDPRIGWLRRLAWLWSIENMILAAAVFNRLFIYIGFNGMSRMRIVGLYGMSAVAVGFLLVVWKIVHNREFLWLVRRHLCTLAIAVYLLALTPMDAIVVGYNVRRILAGDPAPAVQISVHPINSEGVLLLAPLLECDDEIIREGVRALLAEQHLLAEKQANDSAALGWTAYQFADQAALKGLRKDSDRWRRYTGDNQRRSALERFHKYAYQWY
jgi:hypothetical protein